MPEMFLKNEVVGLIGRSFQLLDREIRQRDPDYKKVIRECREIIVFMTCIEEFGEYDKFLLGLQEMTDEPAGKEKGIAELVYYTLSRFFDVFYTAQGK